jgi:hypothetical protein
MTCVLHNFGRSETECKAEMLIYGQALKHLNCKGRIHNQLLCPYENIGIRPGQI